MADNITLPATGTGTANVVTRALDKSSKYTQVVALDIGGAGTESLLTDSLPVRGNGKSVSVTLTVTNGVYSIYDSVGGLITLANGVRANGGHAFVNSVKLSGVAALAYELWFFNADLVTPAADNATLTLVAADEAKFLGAIPITAADYVKAASAFNLATVPVGRGIQLKAGAATTTIYAYLKATAVTSPATTTLYLTVDFEYLD